MLKPLDSKKDDGIIMEFKVFQPKKEKELRDTVAAALRQIEEKGYEEALIVKRIPQKKYAGMGLRSEGEEVLIGGKPNHSSYAFSINISTYSPPIVSSTHK